MVPVKSEYAEDVMKPQPQVSAELAQQVHKVIEPAVEATGLYLQEVQVFGSGKSQTVEVTIDLPEFEIGSVGSDQLGEVSRAISAALDANDVVPGAYNLEVSTPGISRPLNDARSFRRARTRLVKVTLADGRQVSGRLLDVVEAEGGLELVFQVAAKKVTVPLAEVKAGEIEIDFSGLSSADFGDDF
jgi:ribosome maturation factor RimP